MAREKDDITKQKEQTLKRLFEDDWMLIHVDTRCQGTTVPDHLENSPSITFKLSRLFQGASEIKNERITADLLFGTTRTACVFPFESIWGATSFKGSNIVWPESAPKEVLSQLEDGTFNQPQPPQPAEKKGDEEKSVAKDEKKPLQRGHLKRIK